MELADIPINRIADYQQVALMRLHVWLTGQTHALLAEFAGKARDRLLSMASPNGEIDPVNGIGLASLLAQDWRLIFERWRAIFEEVRYQGAAIPYGQMARLHQHYMSLPSLAERWFPQQPFQDRGELPANFEQQLQVVLDAAASRIYNDGFSLYGEGAGIPGPSSRIWRLEQDSLEGIQNVLAVGLGDMQSAWEIAQGLEQYLGFGQDCPRWTEERLFGLTKTQIAAGDTTGLITGNPCESKGVAYNALRLARNEIQIVHHMATDEIFRLSPWVEQEQIVLSPAHPPIECACPGIANGGENGDGIYPLGTITLPIHVQCLCLKVAVLMSDSEFVNRMRGWLNSPTASWPAMDNYAQTIGAGQSTIVNPLLLIGLGMVLLRWLDGEQDEVEAVMEADLATA